MMLHLRMWGLACILVVAGCARSIAQSVALTDDRVAQHQALPTIHASEGTYTRYYHLLLKLRPQDFELTVPTEQRRPRYETENRYEFKANGQFEIFVHKKAFPVLAPKCARYIIVRMPGTDPSTPEITQKLEQKRALFKALKELKNSGAEALDVAIELNPYVHVVTRDPLQLELTQCNAFFRQAAGAYVDHVGPLSR
jgi:hypothetical protein